MRRAGLILFLVLCGAERARADASVLVTSAASTIGVEAAAGLAPAAGAGLGVFATRWESKNRGTLRGYGLRAGWAPMRHLGLEARAAWLETRSGDRDTTLVPLEAAATFRWPIGRYVVPFVGGGIGAYWIDDEFEGESDTDNVAGYFALAGLDLSTGPVTLFGEAKYTLVGPGHDLEWRGADVEQRHSLDGWSGSLGLKIGF